jgi:hypothetical protein
MHFNLSQRKPQSGIPCPVYMSHHFPRTLLLRFLVKVKMIWCNFYLKRNMEKQKKENNSDSHAAQTKTLVTLGFSSLFFSNIAHVFWTMSQIHADLTRLTTLSDWWLCRRLRRRFLGGFRPSRHPNERKETRIQQNTKSQMALFAFIGNFRRRPIHTASLRKCST